MMVLLSQMMSLVMGDVLLTCNEMTGFMDNLLISRDPPTAPTRLSAWLEAHTGEIGKWYFSELRPHSGRAGDSG
jgi:hypothetical protein